MIDLSNNEKQQLTTEQVLAITLIVSMGIRPDSRQALEKCFIEALKKCHKVGTFCNALSLSGVIPLKDMTNGADELIAQINELISKEITNA